MGYDRASRPLSFIASLLSKKYTAVPGVSKLQKTAKVAGKATLPEDPQEGREDNNISNLSGEGSSDKEPELIGDIWGPI